LSKKRIIELYLNVVEWWDGIFGIETAARHYFEKSSAELTAMEAARLAAVLPNPRHYNPAGLARYVRFRAEKIYSIMVHRGIVIPDYDEVMSEPEMVPPESNPIPPGIELGVKNEPPGDQESGVGENNIPGGEPADNGSEGTESRSD
ncbi:MAG: transglycosylase domain-containing protein, partial [Syntrophales bacterium]